MHSPEFVSTIEANGTSSFTSVLTQMSRRRILIVAANNFSYNKGL